MVVKAWMKVLMCSMLSFMILFSTVGYAALSTDLGIDGYAEFKVTPGIYITDVRVSGTPSYATATSVGYLEHTTTQNSSFRRTNNRYVAARSMRRVVTANIEHTTITIASK